MSGKVVQLVGNTAIGGQASIADMLEQTAQEIRDGKRPELVRVMLVALDGIGISIRIRGAGCNAMEGIGMLEYAKNEIMMDDRFDED
jgi:hypothetical protein